ncbi:MAG: DUF6176 family protein [Pseudomonadota bacterium]
MEIAAGLIKVNLGAEGLVADWAKTIRERVDEALLTLRDEGVEIESWFELELAGDKYLLWYMRAASIERIWSAFAQSEHDIDHFHLETMTAISAENISATPLVDLSPEGR